MNDTINISEISLDLWAEESVGSVAADCCAGTASTTGSFSTPISSATSAGTASTKCP